MTWIYEYPAWEFALFSVVTLCAFTAFAHVLVLRFVRTKDFTEHNEVAGPILAIIGTMFAVLLSFCVIVVWQEFDAADGLVSREAGAVADLHHLADTFPSPLGPQLKAQLDRYVALMIAKEWPAMEHGAFSVESHTLVRQIAREIADFKPRTVQESNMQASALVQTNVMLDARRSRLHANETGIPVILWWTLDLAAAITIAFSFLFGIRDARVHIVMTIALTATIALIMVLIAELDYPFRGDTAVSPNSWVQVQRQLHSDR